MHFRVLALAVLIFAFAWPARAQQSVKLQFNGGQVTLSAQNAPVRVILAEWARLGGATIVNGDRVAGPPVTLELTGASERQALDIVLRGVAGYMLAPRRAGSQGASEFDRILILPTSVAPRNPAPSAVASGSPRPQVLPRPSVVRQPEASAELAEGRQDGVDPVGAQDPSAVNPPLRPTDPRLVRQPFVRPPVPDDSDETADDAAEPGTASTAGVAPTPTNPFGIPFGSSTTPAPLPQQQQPNRVQ